MATATLNLNPDFGGRRKKKNAKNAKKVNPNRLRREGKKNE